MQNNSPETGTFLLPVQVFQLTDQCAVMLNPAPLPGKVHKKMDDSRSVQILSKDGL